MVYKLAQLVHQSGNVKEKEEKGKKVKEGGREGKKRKGKKGGNHYQFFIIIFGVTQM